MRGSVAGITYTANSYQAIVGRARVSPVQPNTNNQASIKNIFANCSQAWNELTDTQRQGWNDYAATLTKIGPLGEYKITGRNVFMGTFTLAYYINYVSPGKLTIDYTPPTIAGWFNIEDIEDGTPVGPITGFGISIVGHKTINGVALTQGSIAQADGRQFWKGPYLSSQNTVTDITANTTVVVEHDGYQADQVAFSRTRCITAAYPFRINQEVFLRHITGTYTP